MSVVGNIFVAVGACVFGIVIWSGFLDFLDFLVYLELLEEVGVLVWWSWPDVWEGGGVNVSEDADWNGGGNDGLGCVVC